MAKVGCPPRYKNKKEIEVLINKYFVECEGELLKDNKGDPVLNKYGQPVYIGFKPPTVTGLALFLGFTSRQALLNYQAKEEFVDTITRAKSKIEEYTETRLFDKDGCRGAEFSLKNNFKGWKTNPDEKLDNMNETLEKVLSEIKSKDRV